MIHAPTWDHERAAWKAGHAVIAGVDESGRGPLAGPVVAAAVVLPRGLAAGKLTDSKRLSPEEREQQFAIVMERAVAVAVAIVPAVRIDEINILRATHEAMAQALDGLPSLPDLALVDGLPVRGLPCPHTAIVKGDLCSVSIAAASIVAKVARDRLMVTLDAEHPGYGFAQHKGYPTPAHHEALERLGPCPIHRRSFRPCRSTEGVKG
jgi:ribonuclease HII